MIHKILVNSKTSSRYNVDWSRDVNRVQVNDLLVYLERLLGYRGYLYLNGIYEQLGVEWTDLDNNHVIRYEDYTDNLFTIIDDDENNGFIVTVNYNY